MNLAEIYRAVNTVLDTLDFTALFTGFHKYKYALYTSSEVCLDGEIIPWQDCFRGNTAIEYAGEFIAIWNLELDPIDDIEIFAYLLVHEMFHCHQRVEGEKRYPSDLALLNYPNDIENFEKKYNENLCLADAFEKEDRKALQKFVWIRNWRRKKYPVMVRQELEVETIEGMAEYIGLRALRMISGEKFKNVTSTLTQKLRTQDRSLFDVRRIAYCSGALYNLCLDRAAIKIQNDFASEQTVYEQNPIDCGEEPVAIKHYDFISSQYIGMIGERQRLIAACIEDWAYTAYHALLCGYDPMNMFRMGSLLYCKYFATLYNNGDVRTIRSSVILRLEENSNENIVGYYCAKQNG